MILHCNISSDFSIVDDKDRVVSIETAKQLCADGEVDDCNLGLSRLMRMDWDIEKLKQFYIDNA